MADYERNNRADTAPPASITDAEVRRRRLADEIADIAQQLAARKQQRMSAFMERHPDGIQTKAELTQEDRLADHNYLQWRQKALGALRVREKALRYVNDWLRDARRREGVLETASPGEASVVRLINDAYQLFVKLREDDVEFDPEEWETVEKLRRFLHAPIKTAAAAS